MHALVVDGAVDVKGTYPVVHEGREIARYSLRVALPADYPHSLPLVWETGERIPRIEDRHVNVADGSLCLGAPAALWIALAGNFSIDRVLDLPVRNFLIGNSMVEAGEEWPHGEWKHGANGMLQYFGETVGTDRSPHRDSPDRWTHQRKGSWPLALPLWQRQDRSEMPYGCDREAAAVPAEVLAHSGVLIIDFMNKRKSKHGESEVGQHRRGCARGRLLSVPWHSCDIV